MISAFEKFYCKSRLHAYLWRQKANQIFPDFIQYFPPSPLILEIGTGQGLGAIFLADKIKDSKFIAVDNEQDMVKAAIENVKKKDLQERIRVEYGDALTLNFPDKSFDAVAAITVLHHVPLYEKAISEAARVLKEGGLFLIVDFDFKSSIFPRFETLFGNPASLFSWKEMSEVLQKAGFETVNIKFYGMGMFCTASVRR